MDIATEPRRRSNAPMPAIEKQGIIADHIAGLANADIAVKFNRHPATVSRVINELRKCNPAPQVTVRSVQAIKAAMLEPASRAIHAGLGCEDDPYKRGNLGVQVLKGIGVFAPDHQAPILAIMQDTPKEWRNRYLEGEAKDVTQE